MMANIEYFLASYHLFLTWVLYYANKHLELDLCKKNLSFNTTNKEEEKNQSFSQKKT